MSRSSSRSASLLATSSCIGADRCGSREMRGDFDPAGGRPPEEMDRLAVRARADVTARATLIHRMLPVARRWARRYAGRGVTLDDLTQDAVLGVLRAVSGYDPARGPFSAWAKLWVRQALQQAVAERSRPFRLPTHVLWDMHELKQARERLTAERQSEPGLQALADALGWGVDRVGDVVRAERAEIGDEGVDLLDDPIAEGEFEAVLDAVAGAQTAPLLLRLSERERGVLEARARGESLRAIGRTMGLSAERVRKIERQARAKLGVAPNQVDTPRLLVTKIGDGSTPRGGT